MALAPPCAITWHPPPLLPCPPAPARIPARIGRISLRGLRLCCSASSSPSPARPSTSTSTSTSSSTDDNDSDSDSDSEAQRHASPPPWLTITNLPRLARSLLRSFPPPPPPRKLFAPALLLCAALALALLASRLLASAARAAKVVPYSDLVRGIHLGQVASVDFHEGSRCISFLARTDSHRPISCRTRKIDRDEKFLLALLRDNAVVYRSVPPPVSRLLLSCLGTIAGLWIGVLPLIWILERRLHGGAAAANKKRAAAAAARSVSFDDVQGVDSAKQELIEVVRCLQGSLDYKKLGAKLPAGILLVGPPGTGKTLLARAVASEADVPFFSVSASEFVELYVGRGAARIRELFKEARREAPAVVFIDELDAVGTERDGFSVERDQTLNQLLTEMDGFNSDNQLIVLAATNRLDALDPALLRPGRLSRKVYVGEPDLEGRKKISAVHLRRVPLEEELDVVCDLVASLTAGFVGADLANIANEAALLAVRRGIHVSC